MPKDQYSDATMNDIIPPNVFKTITVFKYIMNLINYYFKK